MLNNIFKKYHEEKPTTSKGNSSIWNPAPTIIHKTITTKEQPKMRKTYEPDQDNDNFLETILASSDLKITKINEYIKSQGVRQCDITELNNNSSITDNYYYNSFDNNYYLLSREHCSDISTIINFIPDEELLQLSLKKRPVLFKQIMKILEEKHAYLKDTNILIEGITKEVFAKIVIRVLSLHVMSQFGNKEAQKEPFSIGLNNLCQVFGEAFVSFCMNKYIYYKKDEEEKKIVALSFEELKELASLYKTQENFEKHIGYCITPLIFNIMKNHLLEKINTDGEKETPNKQKKEILKNYITIGAPIVTLLEEAKLVQVEKFLGEKHEMYVVKLNIEIIEELTLQASHYKPALSPDTEYTETSISLEENLILNINRNNKKIKKSDTVYITDKPSLNKIIDNYSDMPMTVQKVPFKTFKELLIVAKEESRSTPLDDTVLNTVDAIYNINITQICSSLSEQHKALLASLVMFAFDFKQYYSIALEEMIGSHLFLRNVYNQIVSGKYFLRYLLNDLNIFSNFRHIYIPKYIASTGRFFSKPFVLQLQGHKLCNAFITFPKAPSLTELQYNNFLTIMKTCMPNIEEQYLNNSFDDFQNHKKYLMTEFLKSFCIEETPFQYYDINKHILDQVTWLYPYVKKKINILYVNTLIQGYILDDYDHFVYQKDATSSGIQIIGLLTRSKSLCKWGNITGTVPSDIYQVFQKEFETYHLQGKAFLEKFTVDHFSLTLEEFFTKHTMQNKPLQEILLEPTKSKDTNISKSLEQILLNLKIPGHIVGYVKMEDRHPTAEIIHKLRILLKIHKIMSSLPKQIFTSRKLFKKAVMTYGYGAGDKARLLAFKEFITNMLSELGYATVNEEDLNTISDYLNKYFMSRCKTYLFDITSYNDLIRNVIQDNKKEVNSKEPVKIEISSELAWHFRIFKIDNEGRVRVTIGNKRPIHLRVTTYTNEKDYDKMISTLGSILIHSIESTIVGTYVTLAAKINTLCKQENIPLMIAFANHDCFGINTLFAFFLTPIMQYAYNKTLEDKRILDNFKNMTNSALLQQIKSKTKISCTNIHFIKH